MSRTLARKLTGLVSLSLLLTLLVAFYLGTQPYGIYSLVPLIPGWLFVFAWLFRRVPRQVFTPLNDYLARLGKPDEPIAPYQEFEFLSQRIKRAEAFQEAAETEKVEAVARTEKHLLKRIQELQQVHQLLEVFGRSLELKLLADLVLKQANELVPLQRGTIYVLDEEGQFQLESTLGFDSQEAERLASKQLSLSTPGFGVLARTSDIVRVEHEPLAEQPLLVGRFPAQGLVAYHLVPLVTTGSLQGFMELLPAQKAVLSSEVQELLMSLSRVMAVAIQNWRLYAQLRREKQASEAILEHMADGVFTLGENLELTSFNQAGERITGWSRAQLLGRSYADVFSDSDGQRHLGDVLAGRQPATTYEHQVPVKDGLRKIVAFSPSVLRPGDQHDGKTALIVVFRDITRIRELEMLRGDFTATLSHELRTPITCIKGYLHNMMHKKYRFEPETTRSHLGIINTQADRLNRLIQDLLEAARLDSQALEIRPKNIDLSNLISRVVDAYRLKEPDKVLRWEPNGEMRASCDPDQIRYVLDHLLSNACKYSEEGGLVDVTCEQRGRQFSVSVRDEGCGIPFDHQEKIFEKYHRVEVGNTRTHYGVGLGLFIARKIVEAHGGEITVQSAPEHGSTFMFTLPTEEARTEETRPTAPSAA